MNWFKKYLKDKGWVYFILAVIAGTTLLQFGIWIVDKEITNPWVIECGLGFVVFILGLSYLFRNNP